MKQDDEHWRQALAVYQQLQALGPAQLNQQLETMDLPPAVVEKVQKLSVKMQENSDMLELGSEQIFAKAADETVAKSIIGKRIDSYKIIDLIAKGGMSSIFKAINIQAKINKPVALKLLSPYAFSEKAVELFKREQLILSQLQHPNIVSFHHSGTTEDGTHYLIMELVEGAQTIKEFCEQQQLDKKQIIRYVIKLGEILSYAHSNLIIHRDIKPANVLIDQHGSIKVIDFGIAQIAADEQATSTRVFTKDSASPEQILGQNVGTQTDVFSLGAILLELLVQAKPLPDINIANYDPLDDTKHVNQLLKTSDLDKDLQNIIRKAMHVDVKQRYPAMGAFVDDLQNWLQKKPISATSDTPWYKIKKFVLRNPLSVGFASLLFVALSTGLWVVNNYATRAQIEADKANETLTLITKVFSQADSWNPPDPDKTLKQALDDFVNKVLPQLSLDKDVEIGLYHTLGKIHGDLKLYEEAKAHYIKALNILPMIQQKQDRRALVIRNEMTKLKRTQGQGKQISDEIRRLYDDVIITFEDDYSLRLDVLTNLMISYFYHSNYDSIEAENTQFKMLDIIQSGKVDDQLLVSRAYDALSARQKWKKNKDYKLAEHYILLAMDTLDSPQLQRSEEYFKLLRSQAILNVWQGNLDQGKRVYEQVISQLEATRPPDMFLAETYDGYSTILYRQGLFKQAIASLNKSIEISKLQSDQSQVLYPLLKRANYHLSINDFTSSLNDLIESAYLAKEYRPDFLSSTLLNIGLILFALDLNELGQMVMEVEINKKNKSAHYYQESMKFSYLISGIHSWSENNMENALTALKKAEKYQTEKYDDYKNLLSYLIDPQQQQNNTEVRKGGFINELLYLLQIQGGNFDRKKISEFCQLSEAYRKVKIIAVRELFLRTCHDLLSDGIEESPRFLKDELETIRINKESSKNLFEEETRKKILNLLK